MMRPAYRVLVVLMGWLMLAPIAVLLPAQPASALVEDGPQTIFDAGTRTSGAGSAPASVVRFQNDFRPCLVDNTCPDQQPQGTTTPTPVPSPTPIPRDPVADANASASAAVTALTERLKDPHWAVFPHHQRQVVGLDSFLYIADLWEDDDETGPLVGEQQVFVTATPTFSVWEFTELGTGATFTLRCNNEGEPWTEGDTVPRCGKEWAHSSSVTGNVKLKVGVEFDISWSHAYSGGSLTHVAWSDQEPELIVNEVLSFGIDEDSEYISQTWEPEVFRPDDGVDCGWGAHIAAAPIPGVGCEAFQLVWDLFKGFLGGCVGTVISRIVELWDTAKSLATDPVGFVKDKVAGLTAMIDLALEDPIQLATDLGYEALGIDPDADLSTWSEDDWADWAGGFFCGLAFDYITGKAQDKVFDYLDRKINGDRGDGTDGPNGGDDDGSSGDDDGSTGDDDNGFGDDDDDGYDPEEDDNQPIVCNNRQSSFPGDTLVMLEDGSYRAIEDIRPGDQVLSYNTDTSVWEPKLVLDQWSHLDRGPPAVATLTDGSSVTATADHLFYVPATQTWVQLQDLTLDDELLSPDGRVELASIEVGTATDWTVWELTVADNHNFTVSTGTTDVLVHNNGADVNGSTPADIEANWQAHRANGGTRADWFDNLSLEQVGAIRSMPGGQAATPLQKRLRGRLAGGLRGSGGVHEFFPVSRAEQAKRLGLTSADIHGLSVDTDKLVGFYPPGHELAGEPFTHGFDEYHQALFDAIDGAESAQEALEAIDKVNQDYSIGTIDGADGMTREELLQAREDGLIDDFDARTNPDGTERDWSDKEYDRPEPPEGCP